MLKSSLLAVHLLQYYFQEVYIIQVKQHIVDSYPNIAKGTMISQNI